MSRMSSRRSRPPSQPAPCRPGHAPRGCLPFAWGARTYVVGIVNSTPDSFAGDGRLDPAAAVEHGLRLAAESADLLDVGGESARPGAPPVPAAEERRRVLPAVEALATRAGVPVSIDTSKAGVADAADAGPGPHLPCPAPGEPQ
jgi:dihydropteroate synthase